MFGLFKKAKGKTVVAPISGQLIAIDAVSDDVFSQKMMGDGFAVTPADSVVYAPVAGKITTVFPTKHAIGITTPEGLEVLVHMGLDTVELNGAPFVIDVEVDDTVAAGDRLGTIDSAQIKASGRDDTIVVVYTNMDLLKSFPTVTAQAVDHGDEIGQLTY
jgi:PTS system glucose-specific IIA component